MRSPGPPPASSNPVGWLLLMMGLSVGLPALVLSATTPLLQSWFSRTPHHEAGDPYFLYSASNLGSFAALLGYPLLAEPLLGIQRQRWAWAGCYLLLLAAVSLCARHAWRCGEAREEGTLAATPRPTREQRGWWLLLSFVPSSLLLGVTGYITNDIAAVPLLWIVPLALYLLTFIIVFARTPLLRPGWMLSLQLLLLPAVALIHVWRPKGTVLSYAVHLLTFFVTAMVCHGELARRRPPADHLTEFYLWLAVGGLLGGIFNALAAPLIFPTMTEYWIVLALAAFLRPGGAVEGRGASRPWLWPAILVAGGALLCGAMFAVQKLLPFEGSARVVLTAAILLVPAGGLWWFRRRPARFGLAFATMLLAGTLANVPGYVVLHRERNFFGSIQVLADAGNIFHVFYHGTTVHGVQKLTPSRRRVPLTYFFPTGPLGNVFSTLGESLAGKRIAVVGLGAGSIAAYGQPGQRMTYYEIDPAVERVARDPRWFTFLADSPARVDVVIGDARLRMADAPDHAYRLIVIDAFSSDAIPVHVITREALRLYLSKLEPDGMIALNLTNSYLDLLPVARALAADAGLLCAARFELVTQEQHGADYRSSSSWVVMAPPANREAFDALLAYPGWHALAGVPGERVWTDDYSNILGALVRPAGL